MRPDHTTALSAEACAGLLDVSRETGERLQAYLDTLLRWQARINLVGPTTLADPWRRHILDCGQLRAFVPDDTRTLVDLGSGAGLPGLVLAILGVADVHLIEADKRKAAFLREAARAAAAVVTVHACRIEAVEAIAADVVTARALAPLTELLTLATRFMHERSLCLFPKGRAAQGELTAARQSWTMRSETRQSLAAAEGTILVLREVRHAPG